MECICLWAKWLHIEGGPLPLHERSAGECCSNDNISVKHKTSKPHTNWHSWSTPGNTEAGWTKREAIILNWVVCVWVCVCVCARARVCLCRTAILFQIPTLLGELMGAEEQEGKNQITLIEKSWMKKKENNNSPPFQFPPPPPTPLPSTPVKKSQRDSESWC